MRTTQPPPPDMPINAPRLIGLMGYARTGKDTVAGLLTYHQRLAFADALKEFTLAMNPPTRGKHTGAYHLLSSHPGADEHPPDWERLKANPNVRSLLQNVGVAARDHLGPDVWVNALAAKIQPGGFYVVTDVRFPNEVEFIQRQGGELWRVVRPGTGPVNDHISETAVADVPAHRTIVNDRSIEELAGLLRSIERTWG